MADTPQSVCSLGTYVFRYNAPSQKNPVVVSSMYTPTLGGGYITVYGAFQQDRMITLAWPTCPEDIYNGLLVQYNLVQQLAFTDWNTPAVSYTVFCEDLTHDSQLPGSTDAYTNVVLKMRIISQP